MLPFHFHMSGYVSGSILFKNVVLHFNQQGFVVYGTRDVDIGDNVAFEVFVHCYFTEGGIETDNTFQYNLGASIRKPIIKVIDGDNDKELSIFSITNPMHHW